MKVCIITVCDKRPNYGNRLRSYATIGNYIAFIDSDDFIEEDYIETLYINIGDADIISSNFKIEYDVGTVKRNYKMPSRVCMKTSKEEFFSDCIDAMIYTYVIWGELYRKDILRNIRFENQAYAEDTLFVRRIFLDCGTMCLIPYNGYNYFIGDHNATSDKKRANEKMAGELNMLLYTWSMCKNNEININYIMLEKKICNTLNSILKHSLRYHNELSGEVCEVLKKSLKTIKSFRSVKHLQYFGVYFIVRILITIERIKYNR